jgi:tetratricopeptide (TPR) repeat protein
MTLEEIIVLGSPDRIRVRSMAPPNACIECHTTQEDQWAADAVEDWYGKDRQDHFSDYLIRYAHDVITPKMKSEMLSFVGDTSYPGIARATALEYLPADGGREEYQTLVRTSSDKNSLVRAHTYIKLSQYTDNQRVALALKGVEDEVRMVRVAAANLLVGVPELELAGANKEMLKLSRKEHYEMLVANLDFPSGRLQFGDYFTRKGQFALAIEQYKWGIMEDKRLIPAYSNLATAYNNLSQNDSALVVLNRWIDLEPSSRGYYLRALLLFEMERKADAIDDLNRSIKYDPKNVRAYYNLATIFIQDRNIQKAKEIVTRGLKELPDNEDLKSLQPYLNEI